MHCVKDCPTIRWQKWDVNPVPLMHNFMFPFHYFNSSEMGLSSHLAPVLFARLQMDNCFPK